jgi:hypothetical protein
MRICKLNILLFLLLVISSNIGAQGIRRNVISFYGSTSNNLKLTAGQTASGSHENLQNSFVIGFQQPLMFKVDASLNVKLDTILCANEKLILRAGRCFSYQWFRNDTLILNYNTDSLIVEKEGSYKFVGSDGIAKFDTSKKVKISYQIKTATPFINTLIKDTLLCFYDTLRLRATEGFDKYLWSSGDTTQSILTRNNSKIYVFGAKRIGLTNKYCYSDSSNFVLATKNNTPIPSITRVSDDLISSQSLQYKWFMNNALQPNFSNNTYRIQSKGFYRVETSIDKLCWSRSKDFIVQLAPVSSQLKDYSLSVYPNPTTSLFFLQLKLEKKYSGFVQITIVDSRGVPRVNQTQFIFNDSNIRIPFNIKLNKGTYTIQVKLNGYQFKTVQIIGL